MEQLKDIRTVPITDEEKICFEIGFAEGRRAGIVEVVEWIEQHSDLPTHTRVWQEQLKKWGIK